MTQSPSAPPAWYPDPSGAPLERWWDGEAWTDATHKPYRPGGMYSAEYTRRTWPGLNRFAQAARFVNLGGFVLILVGMFVGMFGHGDAPGTAVGVVLVLLGLAGCIVGLVLAIVARSRSARLGGDVLALWQIIGAPLGILFALVALAIIADLSA